jgi:DNA-binding IclR family transcriptional regulator
MKRVILDLLADGPRTVPELAEALGIPRHEAMWWMMGYVRYGSIAPTGEVTDDGYYTYRLVEGTE